MPVQFIQIGNHFVNVAMITSWSYAPAIKPLVMDGTDERLQNGDVVWDAEYQDKWDRDAISPQPKGAWVWADEHNKFSERKSAIYVKTSELIADEHSHYDGDVYAVTNTNMEYRAHGDEADVLKDRLGMMVIS